MYFFQYPHKPASQAPPPASLYLRRQTERMATVLVSAFSCHTGIRLAEVGFLITFFGGAWLASAQIPRLKVGTLRFVGGAALALGAVCPKRSG